MQHAFRALAALAVLAVGNFTTSSAQAGEWEEIRGSVFGARHVEDGRAMVTLSAPTRPEDMRTVPIGVEAALRDGRTIKSVTVIIDENPTPVVGVFHVGQRREQIAILANFRVDRQSDVRAVVEASDGALYMVSQLVKFAGGQASCSAPPQGDPAEIAANMGKMNLTEIKREGASSAVAMAQIDLNHPNHTGMVMDQQTLLYVPMKMVSEITARQGGEDVMRIEGSIALSQNPMVKFDFKRGAAGEMTVTMKDTDGGSWTKTFPLGPQS